MADHETRLSVSRPTPLDIVAFIPYACYQMEAPFEVRIITRVQKEYVSVNEKPKKMKGERSLMQYTSTAQMSHEKEKSESKAAFGAGGDGQVVWFTALLDSQGHLVELIFERTVLPTLLLEVIGICLPYQQYLDRVTVRFCTVDGYSIYEIAKHLRRSQITELYLDDSPVPHCNQFWLLEFESRLKTLSLERCRLNDKDCIEIAARLVYPAPASRMLCVLSLACNLISDEGAFVLGAMLRSNRKLRFLNLSGNHISDAGAISILNSLMEFPMTYDEITSKRSRTIQYLKLQKQVYMKCYNEIQNAPVAKSIDDRGSGKKKASARSKRQSTTVVSVASEPLTTDNIAARAEKMTLDLIGTNEDPFRYSETIQKDSYMYSVGNLSLSYINLSYNNLGHLSLVKLSDVLRHQEHLTVKSEPGLVRVMLEGNPLPVRSRELEAVQDFIDATGMSKQQHSARSRVEKFKGIKLTKK